VEKLAMLQLLFSIEVTGRIVSIIFGDKIKKRLIPQEGIYFNENLH
jgi:hypothetical protein